MNFEEPDKKMQRCAQEQALSIGQKRDMLVRLALEKCVSIYHEWTAEAGRHAKENTFLGKPPKAMVIKYGKYSRKDKADFEIIELWKVWYYSNETLKEADIQLEPVMTTVSGMFYPEAWAEFAVNEETPCLYLSCYFGPRNAIGYCYKIEEQENTPRLCGEKVLWVA